MYHKMQVIQKHKGTKRNIQRCSSAIKFRYFATNTGRLYSQQYAKYILQKTQ